MQNLQCKIYNVNLQCKSKPVWETGTKPVLRGTKYNVKNTM